MLLFERALVQWPDAGTLSRPDKPMAGFPFAIGWIGKGGLAFLVIAHDLEAVR